MFTSNVSFMNNYITSCNYYYILYIYVYSNNYTSYLHLFMLGNVNIRTFVHCTSDVEQLNI